MEARCNKCRKKVEIVNPVEGRTKKNTYIVRGTCKHCGTKVCVFGMLKPSKSTKSPEKVIKVEEQKDMLPPVEEQKDRGTSQSPAPQSSPRKSTGWDLLVSALLCLVTVAGIAVGGGLLAYAPLPFLVFQLDAFSQLLTSISGVFVAGKDRIMKRGDMKQLAIDREELRVGNERIEVKGAELTREIESFKELHLNAKKQIDALAETLKTDNVIKGQQEQNINVMNEFTKMTTEFNHVLEVVGPVLEQVNDLKKEKIKHEA